MPSISTLSSELLHLIFSFGSQDDPNFPLTISHVCVLWRRLAHSSSDLWTFVVMKNNLNDQFCHYSIAGSRRYAGPSRASQAIRKAGHYLRLSKTRPLDIKVVLSMPLIDARNDEAYRMTDTTYDSRTAAMAIQLSPYFDRIHTLTVSCDSYSSLSTFFGNLVPAIPLTSHRLVHCDVEWTGPLCAVDNFPRRLSRNHAISLLDKPAEIDIFQNLRHLRLCGVSVDWSNFSPSNLEELSISNIHDRFRPTFQELRTILVTNSGTLRRLSLLSVGTLPPSLSPFELPHVHAMQLGYLYPEELHALISSMSLPSLTHLTVNNTGGRQGGVLDGMLSPGLLMYFIDTILLFEKLSTTWDFTKLEYLKLVDVEFMDDNHHLPSPAEYPDFLANAQSQSGEGEWRYERWRQLSVIDLPRKFWSLCLNVKEVVLERPDLGTLFSLNFPMPSEDVDGVANFELSLPKLERLSMFGMRTWMLEEFLQRRQKVVSKWVKVRPASLELTMDCRDPISVEDFGEVVHTLRYASLLINVSIL